MLKNLGNCHPEEPKATKDLRIGLILQMPGFFAEFTLSRPTETLRCAQSDSERAQHGTAQGFFSKLPRVLERPGVTGSGWQWKQGE